MLNLGSIELPKSAVTKTFAILAKKGAGKSYTAGVMMEEMFRNGIPFVVFDPIDVHWGLRFEKTGKLPAFPIVVFGVVDNADIQLTDDMGVQIAQAVVNKNISCVISTFGMSKKGMRKLITEFSEELLRINKNPRHIFIEEAHEFVPQRVGPDMGRCFSAVESLVVMGRNRGLGVTLINQRAATLNKDVLTQIDTLLAFRNTAPHDRKALQEWVEIHADTTLFTEFWNSLPSLETGSGWIWSPEWLNKFEKIKIRERDTFHPDRESMEIGVEMPKLQQQDVKEFINSFKKNKTGAEKIDRDTQKFLKIASRNVAKKMGTLKRKNNIMETPIMELDLIHDSGELEAVKKQLREAQETLKNVRLALEGKYQPKLTSVSSDQGAVIEMWLDKIGRSNSAGKMLSLLKEKNGLKFTKAQLRTMVGISARSSGFASSLSLLKRNDLVREQNGFVIINPELV